MPLLKNLTAAAAVITCISQQVQAKPRHSSKNSSQPAPIIDAMKHDIQLVNDRNISNILDTVKHLTVTPIWYFKGNSDASNSKSFIETYNQLAIQNKKMLKILAFDCEASPENEKHCTRLNIDFDAAIAKNEAVVRIHPKFPQPAFEFKGEKSVKKMQKMLGKLMGSKVNTDVKTVEEFKKIKTTNPTKQKIFLFSPKKDVPTMLKGLSTDTVFARTGDFYFVGEADGENKAISDAAGASKQKKMPILMMIAKGKTSWYGAKKDQPLDYLSIHEWINVNAESGMGDKVKDTTTGTEEDPDDYVDIPEEQVKELHQKTVNDLCLKQKNICGVWLNNGKEMNEKSIEKMQSYEKYFGNKYNWMWVDVGLQKDLMKKLEEVEIEKAERDGIEAKDVVKLADQLPILLMVKPAKRKRDDKIFSYLKVSKEEKSGKKGDDGITFENVKSLVEKVVGGSTWWKADMPGWAERKREKIEKDKKGDKEGRQEL